MESTGTLTAVVAQHYNQIEEKGIEARTKSRIYHLRNFNNWIKSMLINEIVTKCKEVFEKEKIYVLDIGSGKGGDLLKWKKNNIDFLVCADIAETSVHQCQQRYTEMTERHKRQRERGKCFEAEFIISDCTKDNLKDKFKDPQISFNIISCQFAFHYCFESLPQAKKMITNISQNLKPGGYFIGTIPDAYEIMKRLDESPEDGFSNDIYSVKFSCSGNTFPLFGAQYDFSLEGVVNCPEFLVYFPAFVKLAEEYGDMELVLSQKFEDYFEVNSATPEGKLLLTRMQALEAFPPYRHTNTHQMGLDDDYCHATNKLKELKAEKGRISDDDSRLGTLSQSEWEVACMYLVFIFRKKNSEGRDDG